MYEICEKSNYIKRRNLLNSTRNKKIELTIKLFQRYNNEQNI